MAITAAREEQEFVENLRALSRAGKTKPPIAHHSSSSSSLPSPSAPPWVKELPPVRDGRRQFASGEIIPFLEQHVYPEGGVAEAKRARRREKETFLKTVLNSRQAAGVGTGSWKKSSGRGDGCSVGRASVGGGVGDAASTPATGVVGPLLGLDGEVTRGAVAAEETIDPPAMARVQEEFEPGGYAGLPADNPTCIQNSSSSSSSSNDIKSKPWRKRGREGTRARAGTTKSEEFLKEAAAEQGQLTPPVKKHLTVQQTANSTANSSSSSGSYEEHQEKGEAMRRRRGAWTRSRENRQESRCRRRPRLRRRRH
ncbi:unnamed protein product [Ectocarpus sp. 12 AP-2014]